MLMSLVMAGLLLTAGVFIGDIIKHPDWLVKIREFCGWCWSAVEPLSRPLLLALLSLFLL